MSATTTLGFPYPTPGDKLEQGDDIIKALAQYLNDKVGLVKSGQDSITPSAANTTTSKVIVFPVAFPAGAPLPAVVVTPNGTVAAPGTLSMWVSAVALDRFTVNVQRTSVVAVPFQWMASSQ